MNDAEVGEYARSGRSSIDTLAAVINDAAPIALDSSSPWNARNVSSLYADIVSTAIAIWKANELKAS